MPLGEGFYFKSGGSETPHAQALVCGSPLLCRLCRSSVEVLRQIALSLSSCCPRDLAFLHSECKSSPWPSSCSARVVAILCLVGGERGTY